jgi:RNA polymerase sigma-B factor
LFRESARTRDGRLREKLVYAHADLVERIARGFTGAGEPLEDLMQEGFVGLMKAIDSYDVRRKVKFSTYASHAIAGEIRHYLRDRKGIIRQPGWLHELTQRVNRAQGALTQKLGREPTPEEIADEINLTADAVKEVLRAREMFAVASYDGDEDEEDGPRIDIDRAKIRSQRTETGRLPVEDRIVLDEALMKLKRIEREVIHYLFYKDLSQTEIAHKLNISCNYVSHIVRHSLRKLRKSMAADELRESHLRLRTALERQERLAAALEEQRIQDPVTGLLAGRRLRERLEEELLRAERYGHAISVILFDVVGLERYNDEHGFGMGDELLQQVGAIAQRNLRKIDILSRYDGGTFVAILPHTGEAARLVADRLRKQINGAELGAGEDPATVAVGYAVYPQDAATRDGLMEVATQRMARQKKRRRATSVA